MKRAALVCAITVGLVIGIAGPTSAIGLTQVTLSCDDGTTSTAVVDADTLTGLTLAVQAMLDYPAGLTCTLAQVPLLTTFGGIALAASPGQNPFIVGGGRWQTTCSSLGFLNGAIPGGVIARVPGSWSSSSGLKDPTVSVDGFTGLAWVNIAVNVHQHDDGSFFGTLNETIPANQVCDINGDVTSESHFTSTPDCFMTDINFATTMRGYVRSSVTQTSGFQYPSFPPTSPFSFTFKDNGNPSSTTAPDRLQGPPAGDTSDCDLRTGLEPGFDLVHGNITIHP